jgi:hypothetical protein
VGGFTSRLRHAWNAFSGTAKDEAVYVNEPAYFGARAPDRRRFTYSNERSLLASILTRLAIDAASINLQHVRLDDAGRYLENMISGLQDCLTVEANIDQGAFAFRLDMVLTLFDRGTIAVVPVDTTLDPRNSGSFDIKSIRVGEIVAWYPTRVRVRLYNEQTGLRQEVTLDKKFVAIVENPLYMVMNEPNSTLSRLIRKLNMLDAIDEQSSSGKLDLIIQLPYVIKSEARRTQAEQRRQDIEFQLKGSQYGIAYTDGTEKITQLNRPAENNLMAQIEYLVNLLYNQLGLTEEVMNGTADEKAMINYYTRTIEPVLTSIVEAFNRTFLTKTARTQGQSIVFFRDPFKLVPISVIAEIADKFTRNEILSANDLRQVIGWRPSDDPKANQLRNANMPQPDQAQPTQGSSPLDQSAVITDFLDGVNSDISSILSGANANGR